MEGWDLPSPPANENILRCCSRLSQAWATVAEKSAAWAMALAKLVAKDSAILNRHDQILLLPGLALHPHWKRTDSLSNFLQVRQVHP